MKRSKEEVLRFGNTNKGARLQRKADIILDEKIRKALSVEIPAGFTRQEALAFLANCIDEALEE